MYPFNFFAVPRYYPRGREEVEEGCPRAVMAKTVDYKLVYRPDGVSELYDLKNDKRELSNLFGNSTYVEVSFHNALLSSQTNWNSVCPLLLLTRSNCIFHCSFFFFSHEHADSCSNPEQTGMKRLWFFNDHLFFYCSTIDTDAVCCIDCSLVVCYPLGLVF